MGSKASTFIDSYLSFLFVCTDCRELSVYREPYFSREYVSDYKWKRESTSTRRRIRAHLIT